MGNNFFLEQIDYVYFLYGLTFILLAGVTKALSRVDKGLSWGCWAWLSMFGLVHGINEWLSMLSVTFVDNETFSLMRLVLMSVSFIILIEFARKGASELQGKIIPAWVLVPFLALAFSGALAGLDGFKASCRYALALPGGIWSAWVLFRYSKKPEPLDGSRWLVYSALAMFFYALAEGVITPSAPFFPASLINYKSFTSAFGIPIQVFRGLLAIIITIAFWQRYRSCHIKSLQPEEASYHNLMSRLLAFALISILAAGWIITQHFEQIGLNSDLSRGSAQIKYNQIALSSELRTIDNLAKIVSETPSLKSMTPSGGGLNINTVNADIDRYSRLSKEIIVYLLNSKGLTIASSNRNTGASFLGKSYHMRPYFTEAIKGKKSSYVAMGITSKKPGYFSSHPIRSHSGEITGVAVVKYTLDATLEAFDGGDHYFLIDSNGIILDASNHDLVMRSLWPLSDEKRALLKNSGQYPLSNAPALLPEKPINGQSVHYKNPQDHIMIGGIGNTKMSLVIIGQLTNHVLSRMLGIGTTLLFVLIIIGAFIVQEDQQIHKDTLQKSEYALRRFFDHMHDAVIIRDRHNRIIDINKRALDMFGVTRKDALNLNIVDDLSSKENPLDNVPSLWEKALKGEPQNFEWKVRRQDDGSEFYADIFLDSMELSEELVVVATVRDITERKLAMSELQKLSQAIRQSASAVVITDIKGTIEFVNPQFEIVTGYAAEEAIGQNPRILKSGIHPPEFFTEMWATLTSGREWIGEICNKNKKGELYWEYATIAPVMNTENKITNYVAVKEDISKRKLIEEELIRAKKAAEAASIAKSEFLANMSHEIRTPMNAIIGMSELAYATSLTTEQKGYISAVVQAASSLLTIINDILDFSKIEAGKLELDRTVFDLETVVSSASEIFHSEMLKKSVFFSYSIAPNLPRWLKGDSGRLKQVLINLLGNAFKFTEKGEIRLEIHHTEESNSDKEITLTFSVIDTGIGISPEKQEAIFESFSQADGTITRKYGGTGLGLSISKKIVEMMQGRIWVKSIQGQGSTFSFNAVFETANEPEQAPVIDIASEITTLGRLNILLAEDNSLNQILAVRLLEKHGHAVFVVQNGKEAVEAIQQMHFDLVLMDMQMPEMDGLEATRILRAAPYNIDIPIIAMTANVMQEDRKKCLEAGMDEYIAKPLKASEFYETIQRCFLKKGRRLNTAAAPQHSRAEKVVNTDAALELLGGDEELLAKIHKIFVERAPILIETLEQAINEGVMELVQRQSHSLKSMAGSVGAATLQELAFQMELAARENHLETNKGLLPRLKEEVGLVVKEFEKGGI
ncbi:MAG: PAS domain S-box protein [Nitrospirae bacterium]|nr:PAS domain S-box protein [Nitrospirota bacterium]